MTNINFDRATLTDDAATLLATFLRFEFALKEYGFCPKNGDACVEWDRVAKKLGPNFYARIKNSGKANTIMQRPPLKQIARDHSLDWKECRPPANVCQLMLAVRRVRNNLVHGGKSGDPEDDRGNPHRNKNLIAEAQWVIEQALHELDDVKNLFEGRY